MRISDWSSDVCSSDLGDRIDSAANDTGVIVQAEIGAADEVHDGACARLLWRELNGALGKRPYVEAHHVDAVCEVEVARGFLDHEGEIGRASCRVRVCQHV